MVSFPQTFPPKPCTLLSSFPNLAKEYITYFCSYIYDLILGDGMIKANVKSNKCPFLSASDNVLTRA
jgi:hypothetical protein